jgi:hypothetical protein
MKYFLLLSLLISALVLSTSCKKDDDDTNEPTFISGNWNLKNVSGGFAGIDIDYTAGQVVWNFNLETNILTVQNNIITSGPEDIYAGFETGTYTFEIVENGELQSLIVDDVNMGYITLLDDVLQLDEGVAVDGFMKTFER